MAETVQSDSELMDGEYPFAIDQVQNPWTGLQPLAQVAGMFGQAIAPGQTHFGTPQQYAAQLAASGNQFDPLGFMLGLGGAPAGSMAMAAGPAFKSIMVNPGEFALPRFDAENVARSGYSRNQLVEVLMNPKLSELKNLAKSSLDNSLRMARSPTGDVYAWDAGSPLIHDQLIKEQGLPVSTLNDQWRLKQGKFESVMKPQYFSDKGWVDFSVKDWLTPKE